MSNTYHQILVTNYEASLVYMQGIGEQLSNLSYCPAGDPRSHFGELGELEVAPLHSVRRNIEIIAQDKLFQNLVNLQQSDMLSYAFTAARTPLVASQQCWREKKGLVRIPQRIHDQAGGFLPLLQATFQVGMRHGQSPKFLDYDAQRMH